MTVTGKHETAMVWLTQTILIGVLLVPIATIPVSEIHPVIVAHSLYCRFLIGLAFVIWVWLALSNPMYRPRKSLVLMALTVLLGVSLVTAFTGINPSRSLWSSYQRMNGIVEQAHWLAYAVMLTTMFRTRTSWMVIFGTILGVGVASSTVGILQSVASSDIRPFGLLANGLQSGHFTMLTTGIGMALLGMCHPSWSHQKLRLWVVAGIGLTIYGVWLSATRSSVIAGVLLAVIWAGGIMAYGSRTARVLTVIILVIVVAVVVAYAGQDYQNHGMMHRLAKASSPSEDNSIQRRMEFMRIGLAGFTERPILGWGPENYYYVWGRHMDSVKRVRENEWNDHTHNGYLEVLVSQGLVGLAAYLFVAGTLCWVSVKDIRLTKNWMKFPAIAILGTLATYYAQTFWGIQYSPVFMLFTVVAAYLSTRETAEREIPRWPHIRHRATAITLTVAAAAMFAVSLQFTIVPQAKGIIVFNRIYGAVPWHPRMDALSAHAGAFPPMGYHGLVSMAHFTTEMILANDLGKDDYEEVLRPGMGRVEQAIDYLERHDPHNFLAHYEAARLYWVLSQWEPEYAGRATRHQAELNRMAPDSGYTDAINEFMNRKPRNPQEGQAN